LARGAIPKTAGVLFSLLYKVRSFMKKKTLGIIALWVVHTLFFCIIIGIFYKTYKMEQHQKQMVAQLNQDIQKGQGD